MEIDTCSAKCSNAFSEQILSSREGSEDLAVRERYVSTQHPHSLLQSYAINPVMSFTVWTKRKWNYIYQGIRAQNDSGTRKIQLGRQDDTVKYPDNKIISSKYTIWTFLPKNLFEQFRRIANFYFLIMAIVAFAITSPVSPVTSVLPLIFVVVVTGVKQAYEDFLRHRADSEVNNFMVTVIRAGVEQEVQSQKIQVGDIVLVKDEQDIPCDMVLLVSSHKESKCFVTTANLDGETNLKTLYCPKSLKRTLTADELGKLDARIDCEQPLADLYKFHGRLEYGMYTSSVLRQSLIKREQSFKRPAKGPSCCFPSCTKCPFRRRKDAGAGESDRRCDCQCKTLGIEPPASEEERTLQLFEKSLHSLEEEEQPRASPAQRRSSSLSSAASPTEEAMPKMNSTPDMSASKLDRGNNTVAKSTLRKTHKKTDSNVSRVSFNMWDYVCLLVVCTCTAITFLYYLLEGEPRLPEKMVPWTLERKATILNRRKSSLLSTKRPSISSAGGGIIDPLGAENLLLRGARLRNTEHVYGCAIYTGQDTKLALNSKLTNNKFSTVERSVNKFLIFYMVLLLIEVAVSTVLKTLRESDIGFGAASEKRFKVRLLKEKEKATPLDIFEDLLSFFVLYNYVIPISLYVTMEMQKFLGTLFFEWDRNMYDEAIEEAAICNTSDLNEDLGQIDFLFTDKTGTLTQNLMVFRWCSIDGVTYMQHGSNLYEAKDDVCNEQPEDLRTCEVAMENFLLALALCHTVQVEEKVDKKASELELQKLKFNAASPDEKALIEAMQRLNIVFTDDDDDVIVLRIFGEEKFFNRLEVLEFTSDRKRMSVIIEDETNNLFLFCKGAESALIPLVTEGPIDETLQHVADFASRGLRTLVVAYKKLTREDYNRMTLDIQRARQTLSSDRESVVAAVYETVESGLTVLGATGVEDKLQENVKETLESLRAAGIKVWILTGDKVETAVNISMSCGHFESATQRLQLVGKKTPEACEDALAMYKKQIVEDPGAMYGLVVDGATLALVLQEPLNVRFRELCMLCSAVICCRMSPLQKSKVVSLVKNSPEKPVTAAIGDGANDVSMIQEAHVGLGVMGKEGRQATRCSDFAFAKFKFLGEALLVHGHWYYLRVCTLVQYFFYKNIAFILPQFYFVFFNGYSVQPLYDSMYLTTYNILFTSLPVLIYGLLEQNYSAEILRRNPALYSIHANNALMTWRHFLKWFCLGVWHSLVIFFIPFFWNYGNSIIRSDGREVYLELFGTQIFHSSIVVVNLKLLLHSRYWCWPFLASLAISVVGWMLLGIVYSVIDLVLTTSTYFTFIHMVATPNMWLVSLLVAAICLIPDVVLDTCLNHWLSLPKAASTPAPLFLRLSDLNGKYTSKFVSNI